MEKLLSVKDLAEATGWAKPTIYKKAAHGEIPGRTKLGASLRFRQSLIEEWLNAHKPAADLSGRRTTSNDASVSRRGLTCRPSIYS